MSAEPADHVRVVQDGDDELDIQLKKRTRIHPYVIKGDCPDCGATAEYTSYLGFPGVNTPHEVNPICLNCGTELSMMVQINMSVEAVDVSS